MTNLILIEDETIANCPHRDPDGHLRAAIPNVLNQESYHYRDAGIWSHNYQPVGFDEVRAAVAPPAVVGIDFEPT